VGGVDLPTGPVDRRAIAAVSLLGLLSFLPLSIVGILANTPGGQSPFNFLDRWYPPAIAEKEAQKSKKK
jgi:hypothetical protein